MRGRTLRRSRTSKRESSRSRTRKRRSSKQTTGGSCWNFIRTLRRRWWRASKNWRARGFITGRRFIASTRSWGSYRAATRIRKITTRRTTAWAVRASRTCRRRSATFCLSAGRRGADPNSKENNPADDGRGSSGDPNVPAEFSDILFERGTVGAARGGADINSANCQFFITLKRQPAFEQPGNRYTVFGRVIEGINNADIISTAPVAGGA